MGWMKRAFDVLVSMAALVVLAPVLAVVALLVRLRLGPPVFFRQRRIGWKGAEFDILKFRTMTDARDASGGLLPDSERLTPFGRFLRRTSLDELPELLNVLRGEMSLVGPRPLPVIYRDRYSPEQWRRHEVRPGLTGWAQVNGRNATTWPERFAHDLDYVERHPFRRDLKILCMTVAAVLRREGIEAEGSATMHEFTGNEPGGESGPR
ncbi:MAG: sugar transferase [Opitutales bacterium]|nr:sugar transferase [Opitutales bacterium]